MCVIAAIPAGVVLPRKMLHAAAVVNPHGFGMMWPNREKHTIELWKSLNFADFLLKYDEVVAETAQKENIVLHFRVSSKGSISQENCHPFRIDDQLVMVHNGGIPVALGQDNRSDTRTFTEDYLRMLPKGWLHSFEWNELVWRFVGSNKVVLMEYQTTNKKEDYVETFIYGRQQGIRTQDGVWWSNNYHLPPISYRKFDEHIVLDDDKNPLGIKDPLDNIILFEPDDNPMEKASFQPVTPVQGSSHPWPGSHPTTSGTGNERRGDYTLPGERKVVFYDRGRKYFKTKEDDGSVVYHFIDENDNETATERSTPLGVVPKSGSDVERLSRIRELVVPHTPSDMQRAMQPKLFSDKRYAAGYRGPIITSCRLCQHYGTCICTVPTGGGMVVCPETNSVVDYTHLETEVLQSPKYVSHSHWKGKQTNSCPICRAVLRAKHLVIPFVGMARTDNSMNFPTDVFLKFGEYPPETKPEPESALESETPNLVEQ